MPGAVLDTGDAAENKPEKKKKKKALMGPTSMGEIHTVNSYKDI